MSTSKQVDPAVVASNRKVLTDLPFADQRDFENADRGLIARSELDDIRDDNGNVLWDFHRFDFVDGEAPASVNPSLWRQSTLNSKQGLYEVVPGIYQVRGFDLANITFIETDTGVVIMDPLTSVDTARAALALYETHRGTHTIHAVIYTHSHGDHFGGVKGVITQEQVDRGEVQVIAPAGFVEHAISENVYAGTVMARRAAYMYGSALPSDEFGQVGTGLNQALAKGTLSLITPTIDIEYTGQTLTIDGVEFEFQMAPGSEAPAELHFYLPRYRALCMAENANHTMHNVLTLRGALVRDPRMWSNYISEAIELFADRSDVEFGAHHWPTWGRENIVEFMQEQRDMYAYLHDQTVRMMNQGLTGAEIAEAFELPPGLENAWSTRGYYGTVSHNVKAIYQRYMGWFDANPANLWAHPPVESAQRHVQAFGGLAATVALAETAAADGDFRWAATLLNYAVFADPSSTAARDALANVYRQLGFGIENATWRNFYLSGALELEGENFGSPTTAESPDLLSQLTVEQFFDVVAISVNGPQAWSLDLELEWHVDGRVFATTLRNGVFVARERAAVAPGVTVKVSRAVLPLVLTGRIAEATAAGATVEGDPNVLGALLGSLQQGDSAFAIVTPE